MNVNGASFEVTHPLDTGPGQLFRFNLPIPQPEPEPEPEPVIANESLYEVLVPAGALRGHQFRVTVNGSSFWVTCPLTTGPGQRLRFKLPHTSISKSVNTSTSYIVGGGDSSATPAPVIAKDVHDDRERAYDEALKRERIQRGENHGNIAMYMVANFPSSDGWKVAVQRYNNIPAVYFFKHSSFANNESLSTPQKSNGVGLTEALIIRAQIYPLRFAPPPPTIRGDLKSLARKATKERKRKTTNSQPTRGGEGRCSVNGLNKKSKRFLIYSG